MTGWDCSGLVVEVLKAIGLVSGQFDASAHTLYMMTKEGGTLRPVPHALAFYGKNNSVTHVGYCISPTHMVESGSGDSKTVNLDMAIKQQAFVRIRPIFGRKDWLACHIPNASHFS